MKVRRHEGANCSDVRQSKSAADSGLEMQLSGCSRRVQEELFLVGPHAPTLGPGIWEAKRSIPSQRIQECLPLEFRLQLGKLSIALRYLPVLLRYDPVLFGYRLRMFGYEFLMILLNGFGKVGFIHKYGFRLRPNYPV